MKNELSFHDRRAALQQAAKILAAEADRKEFRPAYARMNPGAKLEYNAFEFNRVGSTARAVIIGPWLYVYAPNVKLPMAVIEVTEEMRRERHWGALNGRLRLTNNGSLDTLRKVIEALKP
jgi:hypothetical protein